MACVGRNLARFIGLVYRKLKKLGLWIFSIHKLGLKQHTGKLDTGETPTAPRKSIEMSSSASAATGPNVPDVRVTNTGEIFDEMTLDALRQVSPNGLTNYSSQYQQWPEREADSRSLSQRSLSDLPRSPSRSTIAEPVEASNIQHLKLHDESVAPDVPHVPMVFLLFLITGYCCVGAWFMSMKNSLWTFLDGVYFWFITITTVGFGDLEFETNQYAENQDDGYESVLIQVSVIAFVVIGLALMSACVTLCIERGHQHRRTLHRLMCNSVNDLREGN